MYSSIIKFLADKISIFHIKRIFRFFHDKELKIIFDVGSHKGDFIDCFKKKFKKANFYSFEPLKENFTFQKKKYKRNKNIKIFNYGLSDKTTKLNLKINYLSNASTFSKFDTTAFYFRIRKLILGKKKIVVNKEICHIDTLDNFIFYEKINYIDLIKLDVEGFELKVLKGGKSILKKTRYIIVEINHSNIFKNYNKAQIHKFLISNGFEKKKRFMFPIMNFEDRIYKNKLID